MSEDVPYRTPAVPASALIADMACRNLDHEERSTQFLRRAALTSLRNSLTRNGFESTNHVKNKLGSTKLRVRTTAARSKYGYKQPRLENEGMLKPDSTKVKPGSTRIKRPTTLAPLRQDSHITGSTKIGAHSIGGSLVWRHTLYYQS